MNRESLVKKTSSRTSIAMAILSFLFTTSTLWSAQYGNLTYQQDGQTITITGYTGAGEAANIPSAIDGLPVTRIGDGAFAVGIDPWSVTIPNTVTYIGNQAFLYSTIWSINIPDSVTTIGRQAFAFSTLAKVYIGKGLTTLGDYAFQRTAPEIYFEGNAPTICSSNAFSQASVKIFRRPDAQGWTSTLAGAPTQNWYSTTDFDYLRSNGAITINRYKGTGGAVVVPETIDSFPVTAIGDHVFAGQSMMTSITLPKTVTKIDAVAFGNCIGLTNFSIPDGLTSVANLTFYGCFNLTSLAVPNGVTNIGSQAFQYCTKLTNFVIPESVTQIGTHAFAQCTSLSSVTISSNLRNIPDFAFQGCRSLSSITIPDLVTNVGNGAFLDSGIINIIIPNSVKSIGNQAFAHSALTTIIIGTGVTTLGDYAFQGPNRNIYFEGNAPTNCSPYAFYDAGVTFYYRPDTQGWGATFAGRPLRIWNYSTVDWNYFRRNGTVTISRYKGADGAVSVPDTIDGLPVTAIGDHAFTGQSTMTSITLPKTVTTIDAVAFGNCIGLTNFSMPDGLTSIANLTFYGCRNLTSITLPSGVTNIGSQAFQFCTKLTNFVIPENVAQIGNHAFAECTSLSSVTISSKIRNIPDGAFESCANLSSFDISDSVTNIGSTAFGWCYHLGSITIPESVMEIGAYAFEGSTNLTNVVIAYGPKHIHTQAFAYCTSLASVSIPNSVTDIDDLAFSQCTSLPSIVIPDSVTRIGTGTFSGCINLTSAALSNAATNVAQELFSGCVNLGMVSIPSNAVAIGDSAFYGCQNLTNITMTDGVLTRIGSSAFAGCAKLPDFGFPNSVTSIGENVFQGCTNLGSVRLSDQLTNLVVLNDFTGCVSLTNVLAGPLNKVFSSVDGVLFDKSQTNLVMFPVGRSGTYVIPDGVTTLGDFAFYQCAGITSITVPASVSALGAVSFYQCINLRTIYFLGNAPAAVQLYYPHFPWGNPFSGDNMATVYYRPGTTGWQSTLGGQPTALWEGSVADDFLYLNTGGTVAISGYRGPGGTITIPESIDGMPVTSIGSRAFVNITTLTNIAIPDGVTNIGDHAFSGCSNLPAIVLPTNLTIIGEGTFSGCGLTNIIIPEGVTNINNSAFSACSNLANITLPQGLTTIGSQAFYSCKALSTISLPNSISSIGRSAFAYCGSLTTIVLPTHLNTIADELFIDCDLRQIEIPDTVTQIGTYAFFGCTKLTHIGLPNNLTSIGEKAFEFCYILPDITIPPKVVSIGAEAFAYCYALTQITLPRSVASIGNEAFAYCTGLNKFYFEGDAPVAGGTDVFAGDNKLPYLSPAPGTSGWTSSFGGLPTGPSSTYYTLIWQPLGNTVVITRYTGGGEAVTIPNTIDGKPVTSIGIGAFRSSWLSSITIPDSVTRIEAQAFKDCTALTNAVLGNGVTDIGPQAFQTCLNLKRIQMSGSLTNIGTNAFENCIRLPAMSLPEGLTSVGNASFSGCSSLTNITIPQGLTSLGDLLFKDCVSLTQIAMPNTITNIGIYTFYNCSKLTNITIPSAVRAIGKYAFYNCTNATTINIPSGVTALGDLTFAQCLSLTNITLPDGLKAIGNSTFSGCGSLGSITFPGGLTDIGFYAFWMCSTLTKVQFEGNAPTNANVNAFYGADKAIIFFRSNTVGWTQVFDGRPTALWLDPNPTGFVYQQMGSNMVVIGYTGVGGSATIADTVAGIPVSSIAARALSNCVSLTDIVIPDTVTDIGESAFSCCANLRSINLPTSLTTIANRLFFMCTNLSTITIPNSVTNIGEGAFYGCSRLSNIAIPGSVTTFAPPGVFMYCSSLTNVTFAGDSPSVSYDLFFGASINLTVYYHYGTHGWRDYLGSSPTKLLDSPLIVNVNGAGSITPSFDGSLLEVGRSYTITAKVGRPGFEFKDWTSNLLPTTNSPALTFVMQPNLSLTANFIDSTAPSIKIESPVMNYRLSNEVISATGTASDNGQVTNVWVQLGGGDWTAASTVNNWTNWTKVLVPSPGTNTLKAYAVDQSGMHSATAAVTFVYIPKRRLNLVVSGSGSVSPNYSNVQLQLGNSYSITARPAKGNVFSCWTSSDGWVSSNATVRFTMKSQLALTANFIPSPFVQKVGSYQGLFTNISGAELPGSGLFTAKINSDGTFSANLKQGLTVIPFSGQLSASGFLSTQIGTGTKARNVSLQLDLGSTDGITGQIGGSNWTSSLTAYRGVYSKSVSSPYAGKWTFAIANGGASGLEPGGYGYGTIAADSFGNLVIGATLGDGTKVSQSASVSGEGAWPLYIPLYSGKGSVLGWMSFTNLNDRDIDGLLMWTKPAKATAVPYPGGFTNQIEMVGSRLNPGILPMLSISNGQLILQGGSLSLGQTNDFALRSNSSCVGAGISGLAIVPSTGLFSGRVTNRATGKILRINGAALQKQNGGYGMFTETNQTGSVILEPR